MSYTILESNPIIENETVNDNINVNENDIEDQIITELNKWINDDKIEFNEEYSIDVICGKGYTKVLNWWIQFKLKAEIKHSKSIAFGIPLFLYNFFTKRTIFSERFDILYTEDAINNAAINGRVDILEMLFNTNNMKIKLGNNAIDLASSKGHINVLNWFLENQQIKFTYSTNALIWAIENNEIDIFKWWLKAACDHNVILLYNIDTFLTVIANGNIDLLKLWLSKSKNRILISDVQLSTRMLNKIKKQNKKNYLDDKVRYITHDYSHDNLIKTKDYIELWYNDDVYNEALSTKNFEIIRLIFEGTGSNCNYNGTYIDNISNDGLIDILEFLRPIKLIYINAIDDASANGNYDVLKWWLKSHVPRIYTQKAMDKASALGYIDILDLWVTNASYNRLSYSSNALTYASLNGYLTVLEWWIKKRNNLKLVADEKVIHYAFEKRNDMILFWWYYHNDLFNFKFTDEMMVICLQYENFYNDLIYTNVTSLINEPEFECSICCDSEDSSKKIGQLKCGHKFHIKCINQWTSLRKICPYCTQQIQIFEDFI
jgi:ankyrin repeat protein